MACVSSESQARGAHVLFRRSSVGRKRRPGPPLSKRPPCFMHSVLCDDKRQCGGWNVGLQGPEEGWAYGGAAGAKGGVQLGLIFAALGVLAVIPASPAFRHKTAASIIPEHKSWSRCFEWAPSSISLPPPASPTWHDQSWTGPTLTVNTAAQKHNYQYGNITNKQLYLLLGWYSKFITEATWKLGHRHSNMSLWLQQL